MKKFPIATVVASAFLIAMTVGSANAQIYQATTLENNAMNFGPDGTANPPLAGYWEMGNTITFTGGFGEKLGLVDVLEYGGGDVNYPIQMDIYSGNDPNTGTLLASETAPAGYGPNEVQFNFTGVVAPGTVTYILSLPDQNGSYDSIFLYDIYTSHSAPTIGSGPNSLWYGSGPGSFVANNTYAMADGAGSNFLNVEFMPEGGAPWLYLILAGATCLGVIFFIRCTRLASRT